MQAKVGEVSPIAPISGVSTENSMNLIYWCKLTTFARPFRRTLPAGNRRGLLLLVCGVLLLTFTSIGGQRWTETGRSDGRLSDPHVGINYWTNEQPFTIHATAHRNSCDRLGWFPDSFGLKDHSVFQFDGFYYIVSIKLPDEEGFAYGRSSDLCTWEDLGTIIGERTPGEWDEAFVWAPFVWEENGIFYMVYTGVRRDYTQSIMLAATTNPADPGSWQRVGMIFQPQHLGTLWKAVGWADCRDATVLRMRGYYYMYYTARDAVGPIVGLAVSISPIGPWYDWGKILTLPQQDAMAESPMVIYHAGAYYLIYHNTDHGEEYRIGLMATGPWSEAFPLDPGWANEIWSGEDGLDYTSYLQGYAQSYAVVIDRVLWDNSYKPPRLFVRAGLHWLFIPILFNQ
jgi:hypothetical protein